MGIRQAWAQGWYHKSTYGPWPLFIWYDNLS